MWMRIGARRSSKARIGSLPTDAWNQYGGRILIITYTKKPALEKLHNVARGAERFYKIT
jgi:hypothetical protein